MKLSGPQRYIHRVTKLQGRGCGVSSQKLQRRLHSEPPGGW